MNSLTLTTSALITGTQTLTNTGVTTASGNSAPLTTSLVSAAISEKNQPKRLHVSNIPFRFRDPDLRAMFGVSFIDMFLPP